MKPTEKEINIALDLMEKLVKAGISAELNEEEDWLSENNDYLEELGVGFNYGSTKVCLKYDELENWVIKLSYDRSHDIGITVFDYCAREAENYELACEKGLEKFFAPTYKVGEIEGIGIYLQQKARVDEDYFVECFEDYVIATYNYDGVEDEDRKQELISDAVYELDDEQSVEAVFSDIASFYDLVKLNDFILDREINDLHSANYGLINDNPVIIDFSGYSI